MPKLDEDAIKNLSDEVGGLESEDFQMLKADIPVDAEDGEPVAVLVIGYAKDGKLDEAKSVEMVLDEDGGHSLNDLLDNKNKLSEKDGNKEEEE